MLICQFATRGDLTEGEPSHLLTNSFGTRLAYESIVHGTWSVAAGGGPMAWRRCRGARGRRYHPAAFELRSLGSEAQPLRLSVVGQLLAMGTDWGSGSSMQSYASFKLVNVLVSGAGGHGDGKSSLRSQTPIASASCRRCCLPRVAAPRSGQRVNGSGCEAIRETSTGALKVHEGGEPLAHAFGFNFGFPLKPQRTDYSQK